MDDGGLIALNLVIIAALITVGPADAAVLVATTAFGCALPFEVAGMTLLRLGKDVDDIHLERLALQSFEEANFPNIQAYFPPPRHRGPMRRRRTRIILGYVPGIAALAFALTITGIVASLWHMAAWVGEASLAAIVVSAFLIVLAMAHSLPPESEAEKRLKRRSTEKPI